MKKTISAFRVVTVALLVTFTISGCLFSQTNDEQPDKTILQQPDWREGDSLPDFYLKYSKFTDPAKYAPLYKNLPAGLLELCHVIRTQFIHPFVELPRYRELFPKERWDESNKYQTVEQILRGLVKHDPRGLTLYRKPQHRLVLGCREYALLFASIMKSRGVPVRLRAGHSKIIHPILRLSHTVCEIWDKKKGDWLMVDPSLAKVDFPGEEFDFIHDAWQKMQKGELDIQLYGIPGRYSGFASIIGKIPHDLAMLLGVEYSMYQYASVLEDAFKNKKLTEEQIATFNKVSELMKTVNSENLSKLQVIYNNTPFLQMTRTRVMNSR